MHLLRSRGRAIICHEVNLSARICFSCYQKRQASTLEGNPLSKASQELRKNGPIRTRFAPSPTGYLHLGSLRTALFNYLLAKATGGQFLLRIEDTDQKRTVKDAEERLYRDLNWAGIQWDEGPDIGGPYGPYKQSQRTSLYREHAELLLKSGNAYRCFCTPERLEAMARHRVRLGQPPDYDRKCYHDVPEVESEARASMGEAHVVRLLMPAEPIPFHDLVYGLVKPRQSFTTGPRVQASARGSFDDPILLKSDGFPTYHLANVVDDHKMKITHVVRGSEWMSSTPKHLVMYNAFRWQPPKFVHVGLLLDKDRQKLSKRTNSASVAELLDKKGVFPETLTNFVALLGWSHDIRNDVMGMEDLIRNASLKFTRGESIVSFEKLEYLQRKHAARYASLSTEKSIPPSQDLRLLAVKPIIERLEHDLEHHAGRFGLYITPPDGKSREDYILEILVADAHRYTNPTDFISRNAYFFGAPGSTALEPFPNLKLHNVPAGVTHQNPVESLLPIFDGFSEVGEAEWTTADLKGWINSIIDQAAAATLSELPGSFRELETAEETVRKAWVKLIHGYVRWAIMAGKPGPDGAEIMRILGRQETLRRFKTAQEFIKAKEQKAGLGDMSDRNV